MTASQFISSLPTSILNAAVPNNFSFAESPSFPIDEEQHHKHIPTHSTTPHPPVHFSRNSYL